MKILAVYPGRFQPFHKGHAQVYQWLNNKFGNAVIATSDKVEAPKSPFNFKEKKRMMMLAGVPSSDVQQVTNPYIAREILQNYDPKKTVLIFAVSQKDMDEDPRFSFKPTRSGKPGYLQPYKGNEKNLKPFGDTQSPKGYVVVTPTFTFDVLGKPATSASELRKQFVSLNDEKQKAFIKDLFGKYNASVHKLMKEKIGNMLKNPKTVKQLKESLKIGLTFARKEMPQIGAAASFMKYLRDNDIESQRTKVDPNDLRSSQMEFDNDKVESLRMNPSKNPIIVSNDGHILDGHHRWLADQKEGRKTDAVVCNMPILDLLYHAKNYSVQSLNEEVTRKELAPMLDSFVSFASDKLGLKSMPTVRYKTDDDDYNSFAAYNPSSNELSVHTMNRHPMDIFRSVAHELVHHKQNEDGRIGIDIAKEGETGSDIENEANAEAGKIMRWFAKANPDMFSRSYVVEGNTTSFGGIRGLGNVTGEVSPTVIPQYILDNQAYTNQIKNNTSGLWVDDGVQSYWLDKKGSVEYRVKAVKGFKTLRENLNEGINDPGKLKAIFLAGGPGSGKDFVMNSVLAGEGLREINSDTAFEFLMKKHGLNMKMPKEEKVERDIVRGKAKKTTKKKEELSLAGRLGLIINGTADDLEKIKRVKSELESDGYETMMVFVNTSNEVSKQRNFERGQGGGRKVPDGTDDNGVPDNSEDIRTEKWQLAQENIGELQKVFGNDKFIVLDNSVDIRKASPEVKEKVMTDFNRVRRMTQQFVRSENQNPNAKKWIERETQKRGITDYKAPKAYAPVAQTRQSIPNVVHQPDNELMAQARRLGLSYYGFGRFGRKLNGKNKVMFHSKGGKLVRVQMNEEKGSLSLKHWFDKSKSKDGKEGWKQVGGPFDGMPCARQPGQTSTPKCRSSSEAARMTDREKEYAFEKKQREDPNQPEKSGAAKPTMVKTYKHQKESVEMTNIQEKKDACYHKVKSRYKVWPSAYASGALVKCRKKGAANWGTKSEETNLDEKKNCWDGYRMEGMKKKGNRRVPNCVPVEEGHETLKFTKMRKGSNRPKMKITRKLAENINSDFMNFMEEHGAGDFGTDKLRRNYEKATPKQPVRKKIVAQEDELPLKMGYGLPIIDSGLGPETSQYRQMAAMGFGAGLPLSESIISWMYNEKTQDKFIAKYGELAEEKLIETALMLEEAGCGCDHSGAKSVKKLKEMAASSGKDPMDTRSPIGVQNKDEITERELSGAEMKNREKNVKKLKKYKSKFVDRYGKDAESVMYGVATNQAKAMEEDWQKVNRRDKTDGLSQAAVNAYRRENPGSKLQTAVTEKKPTGKRKKRRINFCRRMKGMKRRLTSAKTARDPNSDINRSLRRWNCKE